MIPNHYHFTKNYSNDEKFEYYFILHFEIYSLNSHYFLEGNTAFALFFVSDCISLYSFLLSAKT